MAGIPFALELGKVYFGLFNGRTLIDRLQVGSHFFPLFPGSIVQAVPYHVGQA